MSRPKAKVQILRYWEFQRYLGEINAVLVLLKDRLQFEQRSACSSLHRPPDSRLCRLIHALCLLVHHGEALLVWGINDTDALAVYKTWVPITTQIRQVVRFLKVNQQLFTISEWKHWKCRRCNDDSPWRRVYWCCASSGGRHCCCGWSSSSGATTSCQVCKRIISRLNHTSPKHITLIQILTKKASNKDTLYFSAPIKLEKRVRASNT